MRPSQNKTAGWWFDKLSDWLIDAVGVELVDVARADRWRPIGKRSINADRWQWAIAGQLIGSGNRWPRLINRLWYEPIVGDR